MSKRQGPFAISCHNDDYETFIELLKGLLTPFPEVHAQVRQQIIDEMVRPLMEELRYAGKEAGGFTKNHAEHTLALVEAELRELAAANEQISDQAGTMKSMDSTIALLPNQISEQGDVIAKLKFEIAGIDQRNCEVAELLRRLRESQDAAKKWEAMAIKLNNCVPRPLTLRSDGTLIDEAIR